MKPLLIVGSYLSPYVRKVLVCLEVKGIAYEVDHIVPFFGDDRFSTLSPLRRIPVLVDGDLVLSDSSVICQYLEDKQPAPALRVEQGAPKVTIQQQQPHAFFLANAQFLERIAGAVDPFEQLPVAHTLIAAFIGDSVTATFMNVAIDKMCGHVKNRRQLDPFHLPHRRIVRSLASISIAESNTWIADP